MKNSFLADFLEMMISFFNPNFDIGKYPYIVIFFRGIAVLLFIFLFNIFFSLIFGDINLKKFFDILFFHIFMGIILGGWLCLMEFLFKEK